MLEGINCKIVVPYGNNPEKNAAIKSFNAELIEYGNDFDEARTYSEKLVTNNFLYVHPCNEPKLIAGVATQTLEILDDLPEVDTILLPLGGGTEVAGAIIVVKQLNPKIKIIGVGGVDSGKSAFEKIINGASLVQLYTGMVYKGPNIAFKISDELSDILEKKGIKNITEVIGIKN